MAEVLGSLALLVTAQGIILEGTTMFRSEVNAQQLLLPGSQTLSSLQKHPPAGLPPQSTVSESAG